MYRNQYIQKEDIKMSRRIPVGVDNFAELVSNNYLFCDKTLMIKELLDRGDKVSLITRPRRWGKSLNMSMLHHFFSSTTSLGQNTLGLFDRLNIGRVDQGKYLNYQGQFPVIFISLKDVNEPSFEQAIQKIGLLVQALYLEHRELLNSDRLNDSDKKLFQSIASNQVEMSTLEESLKILSRYLYRHHDQKVYILIDEYDTPLNNAYGKYLDAMTAFMRNFLGAALKSNESLEQGVMTGIFRVSKNSMLSGLNNLETYTLLDDEYKHYFGFSESEVQSLFTQKNVAIKFDEVRNWYNGYKSGDLIVYNPWSIMSCLKRDGKFDVYWINTANSDLIKETMVNADPQTKSLFETLIHGKSIRLHIDKHVTFDTLKENPTAFWSLLLFAGYLRAESSSLDIQSGFYLCELTIPNQEVRTLYNRYMIEWFSAPIGMIQYYSFLDHLIKGHVEKFTAALADYLLKAASIFDVGNNQGESFYHGFVLALIASLNTSHFIYSNRETGRGRCDIMIIPRENNQHLGIILEFKHVKKDDDLGEAAQQALKQIENNHYPTEVKNHHHITQLLKIGIAFSGKSVLSAFEKVSLVPQNLNTLTIHEISV